MPINKDERSIISIIAEMIKEGETEAGIIKTLKELGAREDEARRMLLVAQAQTFEALKSEINKIIESQISKDNEYLKELIQTQVSEVAKNKIFVLEKGVQEQKQPGFFTRLFRKLFGIPPAEQAVLAPEAERLSMVSEKITEKPVTLKDTLRRLRKKIIKLEAWQSRYKGELENIRRTQKDKKVSPEALEKKRMLAEKVESYKKQIEMLNKIISARERLEIEAPKLAEKPKPMISKGELKTMKELSEAVRAITLAMERVVRAAPKPKIVIQEGEELLSMEQQTEQIKNLQKRLEIDFYKRKISLRDFQAQMLEYQNKLYELEEKKKIIEKSKTTGKEREVSLSKKVEKALEKKLSGRLSEEKLLEIENYVFQLLERKNITEKQVEKEISASSPDTMIANLEKLVRMTQLQEEAKRAIEEQKQRLGSEQQKTWEPQTIIVAPQQGSGKTFYGTTQTGIPGQAQGTQGEKIIIIQGETPQEKERIIEREIVHGEIEEPRETVRLKAIPETRYYRAPREEPRRVLIGPEKTWSEMEIPSYPSTIQKQEREKIRTIIKEIQKYRIVTDLDLVLEIIKRIGTIGFKTLRKETGIEKKRLEDLLEILEEEELVKIEYPAFGEERVLSKSYYKKQYKKRFGETENNEEEETENGIGTEAPKPIEQKIVPEKILQKTRKKKLVPQKQEGKQKPGARVSALEEIEDMIKIQELERMLEKNKKRT